jgi:CRP-like cAMP-binding protein
MKSSLTLFNILNDDDVAWLQDKCLPRVMARGEMIVDHGQEGGDLFVVLEGTCSVYSADGRLLDELSRGDLIGEISFVDAKRTVARVTAVSNGLLARVPKNELVGRLSANVEFAARFYFAVARILTYRLRRNLLVGFESSANLLSDKREFKDEIDLDGLDTTVRAGSRLASLVSKMKRV